MTGKKTCPVCGERYWNRGAHAEACTGQPVTAESYWGLDAKTINEAQMDQFARDDDGA